MRPITFPASAIPYDNTTTGIAAQDVQAAVDYAVLNGGGPPTTPTIEITLIKRKARVMMDGALRISESSGVRIEPSDFAAGFQALGVCSIEASGALIIQGNARGTVLGV